MRCNRRKFIKQCIALYGSLLLLPACDLKKGRQSFVSFTEEQADCIGAICEQIIPTDEYPGALDAGVLNYIDKQLYQRFPEQKARYEALFFFRTSSARCTSMGKRTQKVPTGELQPYRTPVRPYPGNAPF